MDDLIKRLEEAEDGSRELSESIALELNWILMEDWILREAYWINANGEEEKLPHYTTSLDAAVTLFPDGWFGSVPINNPNLQAWLRKDNDSPIIYAKAKTSTLICCVLALKARNVT